MKSASITLLLLLGSALALQAAGSTTPPNDLPPPSAANVEKWEKDISAFEASDRTNAPPRNGVLFIGSSSIRRWTTLARDFPGHPVFNRGFGGSQIADSLHFADRVVLPYQPRQIVMFAGSNDLNARKSPRQVLADFRAFVLKVRTALPRTRISYIAITPSPKRIAQLAEVTEANRIIAAYCVQTDGVEFIDTVPHMTTPEGQPRPELFVEDGLHLNPTGYAIWTRLIGPLLR